MPKYALNIIGNTGNTGGNRGHLEIECNLRGEHEFYVVCLEVCWFLYLYLYICICIGEIRRPERAINDFVGA